MDETTYVPDQPPAPEVQPQPEPHAPSAPEAPPADLDGDDGAEGRSEPNPEYAAKRYVRQRDAEREHARLLQEQIQAQRQQTEALVRLVESVAGRQGRETTENVDVYQPMDGEDNSQYLARMLQQLVNDVNETKQERAARLRAEEEYRQRQMFEEQVRGEYLAFASAEAPDLKDAGDHLMAPLIKNMKALGFNSQEIAAEVARQEQMVIMRARHLGVNPGALIYEAAKQNGYVPVSQKKAAADAAAKRAKAEAARGVGGGGAGAAAPNMDQMRAAYRKAPLGSEERARLAKQILTP